MEDLRDRTRKYALRIIKLYESLPTRGVGGVLGGQIVRSVELLEESSVVRGKRLAALKDETHQLTAILVSLIKKAKR